MPASQVGAVVALSWVTASYALAVNNSASAASALGCSFPKYDNETGTRQWDCKAVWASGQLAECYDDLSYVYGFLATRFAARVTTFVVTADKFGVYQRLAEGTVLLAKNAISAAFLDNCDDDASINACREMLQQCDKEGDTEVFDIAAAGAKKMCEVLQWTGMAGLATALNKVKMGGQITNGLEMFNDCHGAGHHLVMLASSMDKKGAEDSVWNSVSVSAGNLGVAASCYHAILYSFQAYVLRERTCRLYRGLVNAKVIDPMEAGRCLQEDKFDSFAMTNSMDGDLGGNAYRGIGEYVDNRPPAIEPKYVPYQAPKKEEETHPKKEKDEKEKDDEKEFEALHSRTCEADFHKKDEVLLGCLNGIEKLFATLAIQKGADSAVSYVKGDGWVNVVQAVAGLAGVRDIVRFLKTSFMGRTFDLGRCLQRIRDCGPGHKVDEVRSIHALLEEIREGPSEGRPLPFVEMVCKSFEEGGNVYLTKVLRLAACARRTHREPITAGTCVKDLTELLRPIWDISGKNGPLKSIRELLGWRQTSADADKNLVAHNNLAGDLNDRFADIKNVSKRSGVSKVLEGALQPLLDATDPLVHPVIGLVAALLHRRFTVSIDKLSISHSLRVDAEELFKDDLEYATMTMSMWGM